LFVGTKISPLNAFFSEKLSPEASSLFRIKFLFL